MTFRACLSALLLACAAAAVPPPAHAAGPVRIHPLGDSITFGATFGVGVPQAGVGTWVNTPGGYRGVLDQLLAQRGIAHQFVGTRTDNSTPVLDVTGQNRHDGWSGWRVDQVHSRLATWVPAAQADVALVHLGSNDILQRFDPATTYPTADGRVDYADAGQRATFVANLAARLAALVDELQFRRPGIRIVLSDVVPVSSAGGTGAPHVVTAEYASAVYLLAAAERARGERVVFADVWGPFVSSAAGVVTPGLLSHDNVHPTPAGYAVMADVYEDAVAAALA